MKSVGGLLLALSCLLCAQAARADQWIYLQRSGDGLRSYSDAKPADGKFTRIRVHGRPTASASCMGLTPTSMQARAQRYESTIRKYAEQQGLSAALVSAVMRVESCYDSHAVSRAGARGLMQLMPTTAAELGVHDSFDPEQNIEGGVRHLKKMFQRFGNDVKLALAAYNAGPEAVEAYRGVPPFAETKSYVARILKLYSPPPA